MRGVSRGEGEDGGVVCWRKVIQKAGKRASQTTSVRLHLIENPRKPRDDAIMHLNDALVQFE